MTGPPRELGRLLDDAVARRESAAIGAVVVEGGEIAWTAAAGGGEETVFQAGSLSKSVTSAVALELAGRGALDLDADAGERLASWRLPPGAHPTTLRDLLGHTAGANLPFYPGYAQGEPVPTLVESLAGSDPARTEAVEIDSAAAGRFRYSGGGFTIVQQLIEDVTGTSFADVARDTVLDPLGMTRSTFCQAPHEPLRASAARPDWHLYPECGAAGLWTTPSDLARFVCALLAATTGEGGGLRRETADAMTKPHAAVLLRGQWRLLALLGLDPPQSAGLGLFVRGPRFLNLGGAARSFSALTGSSDDGSGAVVMTAGCRSPLALRILFEIADAAGWTGLRRSRRASGLLLRALS